MFIEYSWTTASCKTFNKGLSVWIYLTLAILDSHDNLWANLIAWFGSCSCWEIMFHSVYWGFFCQALWWCTWEKWLNLDSSTHNTSFWEWLQWHLVGKCCNNPHFPSCPIYSLGLTIQHNSKHMQLRVTVLEQQCSKMPIKVLFHEWNTSISLEIKSFGCVASPHSFLLTHLVIFCKNGSSSHELEPHNSLVPAPAQHFIALLWRLCTYKSRTIGEATSHYLQSWMVLFITALHWPLFLQSQMQQQESRCLIKSKQPNRLLLRPTAIPSSEDENM